MKAIVKRPGEAPVTVDLPKGLRALQETVGGYVDAPYMPGLNEAGVTMWVHDEGKCIGALANFWIYNGQDFVAGPALFTGHDDEGETVGLSDAQARKVLAFLASAPDATGVEYSL